MAEESRGVGGVSGWRGVELSVAATLLLSLLISGLLISLSFPV